VLLSSSSDCRVSTITEEVQESPKTKEGPEASERRKQEGGSLLLSVSRKTMIIRPLSLKRQSRKWPVRRASDLFLRNPEVTLSGSLFKRSQLESVRGKVWVSRPNRLSLVPLERMNS
jgi:hypothetical protein